MKQPLAPRAIALFVQLSLISAIGCSEKPSARNNQAARATKSPDNNPPETPGPPAGDVSGNALISYTYTTSSTDADGDSVWYVINWGDGSTTKTRLSDSGSVVSESHTWRKPGTYLVTASAIDARGASSEWSDALEVTIAPRAYTLTAVANPSNAGSISPNEGSFEAGTTVTITAEPNSDYEFTSWGGDARGIRNPTEVTVNTDVHIVANFNSKSQWSSTR